MTIFATIVEAGSLSQAARDLNLSLAQVSKRLSKLEELLSIRLINRSTRSLSMTENGQRFYEHCRAILQGIQQAEQQLKLSQTEISGTLTVTSSNTFSRLFLTRIIIAFQDLHPKVTVQLIEDDSIVGLVESGVDLAIRQMVLPNSSLIAVPIASDHRIICASPEYIAKAPTLKHPKEIGAHDCVVFGSPLITDWELCKDGEFITVPANWRLSTRSGDATIAAAIAGAGLTYSSVWATSQVIEEGHLINVLPQWRSPKRNVYAVYPSRSYQTRLQSAFVKFLKQQIRKLERGLQNGVNTQDLCHPTSGPLAYETSHLPKPSAS
ncbi:MAG: LysR family transcriptional regulator [Pseudoruegeria sp.]